MSWYEIILFCHIACAVAWLGAGLLIQVQGALAARSGDPAAVLYVLKDSGKLAHLVFIPASLGAVVFGVLLVAIGGWGFATAWVLIGLAGFMTTFVVGNFVLKPGGMHLAELIRRDGGPSPDVMAAARKLTLVARMELIVLYTIAADMVLKPSFDDLAKLLVLGGAVAIGIATVLFFSRHDGGRKTLAHAG